MGVQCTLVQDQKECIAFQVRCPTSPMSFLVKPTQPAISDKSFSFLEQEARNGTAGMKSKVFLTITRNNPMKQFTILPLIPMNIGNLYFSFTNPSLFMLLTLSLVLLLVHFVTKNGGGN